MLQELRHILYRPLVGQILTGLFGLLSLWLLWQLTIDLSAPVVNLKPSKSSIKTANNRPQSPQFRVSLFGAYVPKDLSTSILPESLLDMEVVGILYVDNEQDSQVILKKSSGDEKTYRVGDAIADGVLIKRITVDGVMLLRDGVLESLSLVKNKLKFEPVSKPLKEE